ncbi:MULTISPECIES: 4Fe-4S binding protein [unclassified Fusibacter]|uniref:4Fe-4S binding protein n=1 Tax=unclassified Fusibacter TaxID=2624464 RepID=UPI001013B997|nr:MULTISPECIES: 4Fe-4S binding protein [unclassified Fusibacter]MCK8059578.1 4Fe-4S binding protein [Fusibacter sp. A2]NPE21379.1 4Fe-4S binding protein [Fusibacter sp. A1]RXV61795.1 4Fe-4S ferredoxin [Fusibacter sp. A1]
MLLQTGVPTPEDIEGVFPSVARLQKGPIAIFECYQHIPCNPCFTACRLGAITEFEDINDLPVLLEEKCSGCGLCIAKCPGLAITIVDYNYSPTKALMKLPYEFLPLPEEGELVDALSRDGEVVCEAQIVKVLNPVSFDKTPIISIIFDKELIKVVRHFRRRA